ncbi:MAG: hypothetical protein JST11_10840 [Acidobacteria bacterium]|nr:hypothetical protein [Acidobacteriota bacterium]
MASLQVAGRVQPVDEAVETPLVSAPREPQSLEEAGLAESTVETLILKILYARGDLYGRDLSIAIGLRFSVIQDVVELLKLRHHVQIKRSLGVGNVGAVLALTETGRERAREALEGNRYSGPAPVPLEQYVEVVRQQCPKKGWLTREGLNRALRGMVITEQLLSQIGPAVSSAKSLLLYGKPGDGKTFLIESLNNLDAAPIYVPHAIECQGNIVQVYDPVYHHRLDPEEPEESVLEAVGGEAKHDARWVKCRRPFIVSGGELTLDMLDLRFNDISKVYEAPFQLKANNGIYLIDDFGRQRATPAEVLNRWIVPMERRVDYLSFITGGKMTVPFEAFLVFSTNLNPADLGDEAFLRRIQYKMLLRGPSKAEFVTIFEKFCSANHIPCRREVIERFIERHYNRGGKAFRRCHPRDVLSHALNLIHFEKLQPEITGELLDRAFESCFLQEEDEAPVVESAIIRSPLTPCIDYWKQRTAGIPTRFGRMAYLASFRDRESGGYRDIASECDYTPEETTHTLTALHTTTFREWLAMSVEHQSQDLGGYLATPEGRAAFLSFNHRELTGILAPPGTRDEERDLFRRDMASVMMVLSQTPREQPAPAMEPVLMERTA